jgi:hypothetical protein
MSWIDRMVDEMATTRPGPLSLYALLDAAREPSIPAMLESVPEAHQSLYEGPKAEELAPYAPYLVELGADSPLLAALALRGLGKSFVVFVTAARPFDEVRRHFRRFLMAEAEDGQEVYFRFYDPRVLRVFLRTCTREELAEFFGPIHAFWLEGRDPATLARFSLGQECALIEDLRPLPAWEPGSGH